jgi:hypothetical protein
MTGPRACALVILLAGTLGAGAARAQPAPTSEPVEGTVAPERADLPPDTPAPEQPAPTPPSEVAPADVRVLEQRIAVLEEQARARDVAAANKATASKAVTVTAQPGKGLGVVSGDGRFAFNLRARFQLRNTFVDGPSPDTNETSIRTLRLITSGHVLTPDLRYVIQLAFAANDYEKDNASPIFDAYVEYVGVRDANLRAGQFFVPFDRARTMREFALQLVDRPQVVRELTLDRDVGLMLSSTDLFGTKILGYNAFVGAGEGRNRVGGVKPGPLTVGRLALRPWGMFDDDIEADIGREERPRLAMGVAAAYNVHTSRQNSTYGATFTQGTVHYEHIAADLVFKYAGFSLLAEAVARRANVHSKSGVVDGKPVRDLTRSGYGYLAQAGMMVHRLVEVTARWEQLFAASGSDPLLHKQVDQIGNQVGGGANVYLNGHAFKIQADYIRAFGEVPGGTQTVRVQLDASF